MAETTIIATANIRIIRMVMFIMGTALAATWLDGTRNSSTHAECSIWYSAK